VGRNGQKRAPSTYLPLGLHRGAAATIAPTTTLLPPALLLHNCPTEPEACQRHRGPHGIVGIDIAGPRRDPDGLTPAASCCRSSSRRATPGSKRECQAKTVATGCDQLPIGAHGKEEVDRGCSPGVQSRSSIHQTSVLCLALSAALRPAPRPLSSTTQLGRAQRQDTRVVMIPELSMSTTHGDAALHPRGGGAPWPTRPRGSRDRDSLPRARWRGLGCLGRRQRRPHLHDRRRLLSMNTAGRAGSTTSPGTSWSSARRSSKRRKAAAVSRRNPGAPTTDGASSTGKTS
jgi:hypothetical protein